MKTNSLLPMLFSCLFIFYSCTEDDSTETPTAEIPSEILGKWLLDGMTIDAVYTESEEESTAEFRSNGTIIITDSGESTQGNSEVENNNLILIYDGGRTTTEIEELTSTDLAIILGAGVKAHYSKM